MAGYRRWFPVFLALALVLPAWSGELEDALRDLWRGDAYIEAEDYDAAEAAFRRALAFFEPAGDCYHTAYCYLWLGESAYGQARFGEALSLGLRAREVADGCPGRDTFPYYSIILQNLGVFYSRLGDFDRQMAYYRATFDHIITHEGRESRRGADAYFNLGVAFGRRGKWEAAIAHFDTSVQIARRLRYDDGLASAYLNLSFAYGVRRDYVRAIDYQNRALKLTTRQEEIARGNNNLGMLYSDLGDYDQALRCLDRALALRRKLYDAHHPDVLSSLLNVARVYYEAGQAETAEAFIDQVIGLIDESAVDNREYLKVAYHYKAVMLQHTARWREAESYARRAVSLRGSQLNIDGSSLLILASVLLGQGRHDEGLDHVQDALRREVTGFRPSSVFDNPPLHRIERVNTVLDLLALKAQLLRERGAARRSEDDLSHSLNICLLADSLIAFSRRTFFDNTSKELLAADARAIYAGAVAAGYEIYRLSGDEAYLDLVFSYSEKNKSLLVLEKVHDLYARTFYGIPPDLVEQERRLLEDIEFYTGKIRVARDGPEPPDPRLIGRWEDILFERRRAQEALLTDIQRRFPDYYTLKHDLSAATPDDVGRRLLADKEVLLEYFLAGDRLYIFVISRERRDFVAVPLPADLHGTVRAFQEALIGQDAAFYEASHALYGLLLAPVDSLISGRDLVIVPDGLLGYVPFEALLTEPVSPARYALHRELPYVVRRHAVRYLFSASLPLVGGQRRPAAIGRVLGVAPIFDMPARDDAGDERAIRGALSPLPGGEAELRKLKQRFRGAFWKGGEAREGRFKAEGGGYQLLHIATHTLVDERFPSLSKLVFAEEPEGSPEDGFLNAYELYNMQLDAELIVLSACNTGIGAIREGEGIASLARAFAYAGCPNLVMSLWPVKDNTTSTLMGYFYDNLAAGMEKGRALQAARLRYLDEENELFSHPYHWAAFLYVGDDRPVELKINDATNLTIPLGLGLGLLFLVAGGAWWWIRRMSRR